MTTAAINRDEILAHAEAGWMTPTAEDMAGTTDMGPFVRDFGDNGKKHLTLAHWGGEPYPRLTTGPVMATPLADWAQLLEPEWHDEAQDWKVADFEDDQTGQATQFGRSSATRWAKYGNFQALGILNNGTSLTGYEGSALIATSHNDAPGGAESGNLITGLTGGATPTVANLEAAIDAIRSRFLLFTTDKGRPWSVDVNRVAFLGPAAMDGVFQRALGRSGSYGGAGAIPADSTGASGQARGFSFATSQEITQQDAVYGVLPQMGPSAAIAYNRRGTVRMQVVRPEDDKELFPDRMRMAAAMRIKFGPGQWRCVVKAVLA